MTTEKINRLVAEKVMGWTFRNKASAKESPIGAFEVWIDLDGKHRFIVSDHAGYKTFSPSTEISAAWEVVEKMGNYFSLLKTERGDGKWLCHFRSTTAVPVRAAGLSAPLAICLAALKSKGIEIQADL